LDEIDPQITKLANGIRRLCKGRQDRFLWVQQHLVNLRRKTLDDLTRSELEDIERRLRAFLP